MRQYIGAARSKNILSLISLCVVTVPINKAVGNGNINRTLTQKWHVQIANNPRSPQSQTIPSWITVFFLILLIFRYYLPLSSPSGVATCTALHAIRRFRRRYFIRCSTSGKYTLLFYYCLNFSSVFRELIQGRGLFHPTARCKHLRPFVSALY